MKNYITLFLTSTLLCPALCSHPSHFTIGSGCMDMAACNYDPDATSDDGSCCYQNCINVTVSAGLYPNEISFHIYDNDNNVLAIHNEGDPLPILIPLCLEVGCYHIDLNDSYGDGWNGATYNITDHDNNSIAAGDFPNDPAFAAFSKGVYFNIGNGLTGCTDAGACNYNAAATCDDGTCDYTTCFGCTELTACNYAPIAVFDDGSCCTSNCLLMEMTDTQGDGWDDGVYTIYTSTGDFVLSGTLDHIDYELENICLEDGCYQITISGSFFPEEIFWTLYGTNAGDLSGDGIDYTSYYFSVGMSGTCAGCTDPVACNYQVWAQDDNGSCMYVPCVENDFRSAAISLETMPLNTCNTVIGNLSLATASGEGNSVVNTGEDIWYTFTATTPGIRIETTTTANNLLIELQDAGGNMLEAENALATRTGEILNYGNLQAGNIYYIAVRNFDSSQGEGTFEICLQHLHASHCNYTATNYVPCSRFKASYSGAQQYSFNFTSLTTDVTYNYTATSGVMYMHNATSIQPNDDYLVNIESLWQLTDGSGSMETVAVQSDSQCLIHLNENAPMYMRPNENCTNAGALSPAAILRAMPTACGVEDYQWQFTDNNGTSPAITILRGAPVRTIQLLTVPGLQGGHTYAVRVRPVYSGGVSGSYGPSDCISMSAGTGNFELGSTEIIAKNQNNDLQLGLYPNPSNGSSIYLELMLAGAKEIEIQIMDAVGKEVYSNQYAATDELNTVIYFDQHLPNGIYVMRVKAGNEVMTKKFMVYK
ncbi:MAG: T9SS type A sorting domain-containing protein [Flavobacteriales bacterium]